MIRKVYIDGQVSTFLVFEDHQTEPVFNPIIETLSDQAELIESLEAQNRKLIKREEIIIHLMEMTARTGELMNRSLRSIRRIEKNLQEKELPEES